MISLAFFDFAARPSSRGHSSLTQEQLPQFRRAPKMLVAARIDREGYDWLMQYGRSYST
jgi:hypothetical protein